MHPGKKEHKDNLIVAYLVLSMNNKFYEISEKNKCPDRSIKLVYSSTFHLCFLFTLLLFFCHHCHLTSYTSLGLSSFCQVFVTYLHTL